MQNHMHKQFHSDTGVASEVLFTAWVEQYLGIIEHLKEEFGDYTDPLICSWFQEDSIKEI